MWVLLQEKLYGTHCISVKSVVSPHDVGEIPCCSRNPLEPFPLRCIEKSCIGQDQTLGYSHSETGLGNSHTHYLKAPRIVHGKVSETERVLVSNSSWLKIQSIPHGDMRYQETQISYKLSCLALQFSTKGNETENNFTNNQYYETYIILQPTTPCN